jgi:hypothetical protein
MNREIERGNNINLTNLLTRLGNVFPPDQEPPADAMLHQALLAATTRTTQRFNTRRSEQKEQHMESESNKTGKLRRKQDYEQGKPEPWDRVLRDISDLNFLNSEICCFKKLLIDAGLVADEPLRRPRPPAL